MAFIYFELGIVLILILVNGILAMAEIAIVSSRKTRLQTLAAEGREDAKVALILANAPTEFLAVIQVGITLIGVLAGAFGGATIADHVAVELRLYYPSIEPYAGGLAFGVVVLTISFVSLVVGELVPKRLGMSRPETIALLVAKPLRFFTSFGKPVVRLLSWSTDLILRLFGVRGNTETAVTEEELKIMIEHGTASGLFEKVGENIMKRALRLSDRRVDELMTPRPKVVAIDLADDVEKSLAHMIESPHSYFPAYDGSPDRILGLVSIKDLWRKMAAGGKCDLRAAMVEPIFAVSSMPALRLLELYKQTGKHIAIVVDEYGGTAGLITIIDVMESIVGDLPGVDASMKASAIKRKDGSWLVDGMISIEDLKELFHLSKLPREEGGDFQSLGGLVMAVMGRIPRETDNFTWEGFRFEVIDMDGLRVDKVLVVPLKPGKEKKH